MKHTTNKTSYGTAGKDFRNDGLLAILFGALTGLIVLFNTARYGSVFPMLAVDYLTHPPVILFNVLPVLLASFALWLLFGSVALSSLITAAVSLVASFGNYFKIFYRGDPFVAADLSVLREAGGISSRYPIVPTRWMIAELVLCAACVAAFAVREIRRKRARSAPKERRIPLRIALLVIVLCAGRFVLYPEYVNGRAYLWTDFTGEADYLVRYNPTDQFVSHGFVCSFLRSVRLTVERPVDGYSEPLAKEILGRYTDCDIPENKKIDVIACMLEAYADLSVYDEVRFTDDSDVYETWHRISEEGVSGRLITNVFAAGTINSERNFLTGFDTTTTDYYSDATTYVRYFKDQGYTVTGAHPGESWFYNRENVNRWLGFESYDFLQNRYAAFGIDGIMPDAVFLEDVWKQYEERDRSKPYFSFNVTYQNHAPYSAEYAPETDFLEDGLFADEEDGEALANILCNYLSGIRQTNRAIETLVGRAGESDDPIALVFFGDHKPWLGGENRVYNALGINIDLGTPEGMLNYYSTSYVIWMNDAAKTLLGEGLSEEEAAVRFSGNGGDSSPFFLMTKLFDMAGWDGPAFMQLERAFMREEAIAVNRETEFYVLADGTFAKDPGEEVLSREREILYCQYYLKHKNRYAE